ncbi:polysaccharide deacetylase family protein [Neobacillus mesonae]|uniref:polysaccharide deacetylase family protein n=1 Tax=Neobacillus mesonae TaxID=1193713 RepID=UPI00203C5BAC|nr:polysaccharide deacetylase family protein [Neobacillus mesonae]MCM3567474.1 polysaccharide deacetylase [Neobacillus mesonae]
MRKLRRGWSIWSLVLVFVVGGLLTGISVSNYFQAKAAVKPLNQQKNEAGKPVVENLTPEMIRQNTKDYQLEKEWIHKQEKKAFAWRNMKEANKTQQDLEKAQDKDSEKDSDEAPPAKEDSKTPQQTKKESLAPTAKQTPETPVNSGTGKKAVYLTFDDGPAATSGDLIKLLEKYHFKASFFMIDSNIRRYPEAVKLMVKSGEAVGLHSVSHDSKRFYASVHSVLGELNQNQNTLKEISGVKSFLIRTPYGSVPGMKQEYRKAVDEKGYLMWDWNIDSKDWYYKDGRYVNSVIDQLNRMKHHQGPIVILLHERKETLAHLPKLLDYLRKNGYVSHAIDSSLNPYQFKVR